MIVLDNASVHSALIPELCKIIKERGAVIEFLSPYSPELNPIEKGFSKFKSVLRRMQVDFSRNPLRAIKAAIAVITPGDAVGWYRFSGLLPPVDYDSGSKRKAEEELTFVAGLVSATVVLAAHTVYKRRRGL